MLNCKELEVLIYMTYTMCKYKTEMWIQGLIWSDEWSEWNNISIIVLIMFPAQDQQMEITYPSRTVAQ